MVAEDSKSQDGSAKVVAADGLAQTESLGRREFMTGMAGAFVGLDERTLAALDGSVRPPSTVPSYPTPEKFLEIRRDAEAGLRADPDNARLLGLLAHVLVGDVLNGWNGAGKGEVERAEIAAGKALELDDKTVLAHFASGYVQRLNGNHQAALDAFNEAIRIDPGFARPYAQAANALVFLGKSNEAVPMVEKALQLSPNDKAVGVFLWVKGRAYFTLGKYLEAIEPLASSVSVRPNLWYVHAWLVAAFALTDQDAESQQALKLFKQVHGTRADLSWIADYYKEEQYQNPTLQAASTELLKGLHKAGLEARLA
jgi:adenylate cyclase